MKILIDATILSQKLTGMERVVIESTKYLIKACSDDKFIICLNGKVPEVLKEVKQSNIVYKCSKLKHWKLVRNIDLVRWIKNESADINLFCGFPSPINSNHKNSVSLIHDLNPFKFPETMQKNSAKKWRQWINSDVNNNKGIITVSKTIKNEIEEKYKIKNIKCIYPGFVTAKNIDNSILQNFNIKPNEYLLFVSTLEPRKNIELLVKAYTELRSENKINQKLVLAGKIGWNLTLSLRRLITENNNIIWTDHINDEKLAALYSNCRLFIMPSIYEGFGLPVIEAIAYEAPILTSDIDVFRETTNNSAHYFKSNDIKSLKFEILKSLNKSKEDYTINKSILSNYSWQQFGAELKKYLESLVNDK